MNMLHSLPALAVDPALPQRDLLLDEDLMTEYLSRLIAREGDFGVEACTRRRTKYRFGMSLRVLYELNNGAYRIAARAFPTTQRVAHQLPPSAGIRAPELNTIFWIFPHDRKIENLSVLSDIPRELRNIAGETWTRSRIAGYAPEKALTAQCLNDGGEILAYAKVYAGDEGRAIFNIHVHVADSMPDGLHVPRALSYFDSHHLLLLEPITGISFSTLESNRREDAFYLLGKTLRQFHRISPPSSVPESTRLTPAALRQAALVISEARPDAASMVQRLTRQLLAQHEEFSSTETVLLHGDVHPKNVLLDRDQRLFLLDLDQAAVGPAAVDLGGVIAGLYCDACTGSLSLSEASSLTRAFLSGYGPHASLRWHIAAALLEERALRAVSRIRAGGLEKLTEILAMAESVLAGGSVSEK